MLVDSLIQVAKELIDLFGDDLTLTKVETSGYNPSTHKNDSVETAILCKGVKAPIESSEIIPDVIQLTDTQVTMYTEIDNIDTSWLIDGCNIVHLSKIGMQNKLVIYDAFIRCS